MMLAPTACWRTTRTRKVPLGRLCAQSLKPVFLRQEPLATVIDLEVNDGRKVKHGTVFDLDSGQFRTRVGLFQLPMEVSHPHIAGF
jgi:hypothetical protein